MNGIEAAEKKISADGRKRSADCAREHRSWWRVVARNMNASAFNGYRPAYSDYSGLTCTHPQCGRYWRTKAAYVGQVPDAGRRRP
jgi:hypothetical protein